MTQTVLLGDAIELAYGKGLPQRSRVAGSFPVYGSNGQVDTHNEALVGGPGVIVGRKGSVGEVIWSEKDFWPIDTTYYVKLKNPDDDLRYWYYQLKTLGLDKLNSHSAIPGLNRDVAYARTVTTRTPEEQKKIADILGSIDEKIELNRQINETLEQMGQALFRHYFIDNPEAEKWNIGSVDSLFALTMGLSPKGESYNKTGDGLPLLNGAADFTGASITPGRYTSDPTRVSKPGDIIFCIRGTIGNVCIGYEEYCLGRGVAALTPVTNSTGYVYYSTILAINDMESSASGSVIRGLSKDDIAKRKVKIPPDAVLASFEEKALPIIDKVRSNSEELQTLTILRDTLLPRLISGELKV